MIHHCSQRMMLRQHVICRVLGHHSRALSGRLPFSASMCSELDTSTRNEL